MIGPFQIYRVPSADPVIAYWPISDGLGHLLGPASIPVSFNPRYVVGVDWTSLEDVGQSAAVQFRCSRCGNWLFKIGGRGGLFAVSFFPYPSNESPSVCRASCDDLVVRSVMDG